jgi:riboflavin-specific deaminase-like protein
VCPWRLHYRSEVAQRPYVLLSAAMSADGYIDDAGGHRLDLSDAADWDRVDDLRATSDAIMVGARTIRADNPRLLVKSPSRQQRRVAAGLPPQPLRVTVTGTGDLDPQARFFGAEPVTPLVYAPETVAAHVARVLSSAAVVVATPALSGRADLAWLLTDLAARGVRRLMVEGGATVLAQFLAARLADEFLLAVAPVFVADPRAPRLLAGGTPGGRMRLAGLSQVGDMAVLQYVPG